MMQWTVLFSDQLYTSIWPPKKIWKGNKTILFGKFAWHLTRYEHEFDIVWLISVSYHIFIWFCDSEHLHMRAVANRHQPLGCVVFFFFSFVSFSKTDTSPPNTQSRTFQNIPHIHHVILCGASSRKERWTIRVSESSRVCSPCSTCTGTGHMMV